VGDTPATTWPAARATFTPSVTARRRVRLVPRPMSRPRSSYWSWSQTTGVHRPKIRPRSRRFSIATRGRPIRPVHQAGTSGWPIRLTDRTSCRRPHLSSSRHRGDRASHAVLEASGRKRSFHSRRCSEMTRRARRPGRPGRPVPPRPGSRRRPAAPGVTATEPEHTHGGPDLVEQKTAVDASGARPHGGCRHVAPGCLDAVEVVGGEAPVAPCPTAIAGEAAGRRGRTCWVSAVSRVAGTRPRSTRAPPRAPAGSSKAWSRAWRPGRRGPYRGVGPGAPAEGGRRRPVRARSRRLLVVTHVAQSVVSIPGGPWSDAGRPPAGVDDCPSMFSPDPRSRASSNVPGSSRTGSRPPPMPRRRSAKGGRPRYPTHRR